MWAWHWEDQPSTLGAQPTQPANQPASFLLSAIPGNLWIRRAFEQHTLSASRAPRNTEGNTKARYLSYNKLGFGWKMAYKLSTRILCCCFLVGKHSKTWSVGLTHTHLGAAWSWARGNIISNSWALGVAFRLVILYCFCGGQLCWWSGGGKTNQRYSCSMTGGIAHNKAAFCGYIITVQNPYMT